MDIKALFKLTYGLYIVGVKDGDKLAGCVVDAVMQTTLDPATLVLCCHKGTRTQELVAQTKQFALSVLSDKTDPFVIANFGFQSCRTVDKWGKVPHHLFHDMPVLDESAAYLRCTVTEAKDLSTHVLFFCDIIDATDTSLRALSYTTYQECWKPKVSEAFKVRCQQGENKMAEKWICEICGYEYDDETPFEQLPDDYVCPVCGVGKDQFEKVVVTKTPDPRLKEKWVCSVCDYVYDGDVAFDDLPDSYLCPVCQQPKSVFVKE